jgi:hypothetical protein
VSELARRARVDRAYQELRAGDPKAFRSCVHAAEGVVLNHPHLRNLDPNLRTNIAAAIEETLVCVVLEVLKP